MAYQALYRVFRPQAFRDMAGQKHITQTLQNALVKEKFSHAYLFSGPRGTGKTSTAKIMAKAVNCEQAPTAEPCNECASCRGITNGSISDVIEIDAASNNGVDEIREIRDKIKYSPTAVRYKVYIIDEVHMLTGGAFNALLKTLEEPPPHAIFILATTEPHKIPLTIISRCQRFDFKRISADEIAEHLKHVADEQDIEADEESLKLIARVCEGGMRDALSILDQVAAFSENQLTVNDVLEVTGLVSQKTLAEIVEKLIDRDAAEAIERAGDSLARGKDPERLLEDLIFYFRDMLLYKTSPDLEGMLDRAYTDEAFTSLTGKIERNTLYEYIRLLNDAEHQMKFSSHSRIFLEMALVNLSQVAPGARPASEGGGTEAVIPEQLQTELNALKAAVEALEKNHPVREPEREQTKEPVQQRSRKRKELPIAMGEMKRVMNEASKSALNRMRSGWAEIMDQIKRENIAAHAWLLESKPVAASESAFLLAFKYDFHCQMVFENPKIIQMVEQVAGEMAGTPQKVYPLPFESWEEIKALYIEQRAASGDDEGSGEAAVEDKEDPLISEAEKLVGPDLLEIKD